jgi:hypothetical protein
MFGIIRLEPLKKAGRPAFPIPFLNSVEVCLLSQAERLAKFD